MKTSGIELRELRNKHPQIATKIIKRLSCFFTVHDVHEIDKSLQGHSQTKSQKKATFPLPYPFHLPKTGESRSVTPTILGSYIAVQKENKLLVTGFLMRNESECIKIQAV